MSEHAPSNTVGGLAVDSQPALTPEAVETVLQEFRGWLEQAADRAAGGEQPSAAQPEFSWQLLAAEFTALRQEINLQTRSVRVQQEQNSEALKQMNEVIGTLEDRAEDDDKENDAEESLRPLLKTLVETFDALALARREVQRAQANLDGLLTRVTQPAETAAKPDPTSVPEQSDRPWWRLARALKSWFGPQADAAPPTALQAQMAIYRQAEEVRSRAASQGRQVLASILVGYSMSLQRLERSLAYYELEPIDCVGELFDPECMEVVEAIAEPGRQSTEVLEEVRRGYRWRGRLFRFAQVRVAR